MYSYASGAQLFTIVFVIIDGYDVFCPTFCSTYVYVCTYTHASCSLHAHVSIRSRHIRIRNMYTFRIHSSSSAASHGKHVHTRTQLEVRMRARIHTCNESNLIYILLLYTYVLSTAEYNRQSSQLLHAVTTLALLQLPSLHSSCLPAYRCCCCPCCPPCPPRE